VLLTVGANVVLRIAGVVLTAFDYISARWTPVTKPVPICVVPASSRLLWNAAIRKALNFGNQVIGNPGFVKVVNVVKNEFGFDFFRCLLAHVSFRSDQFAYCFVS
jgi:hypothetical protein